MAKRLVSQTDGTDAVADAGRRAPRRSRRRAADADRSFDDVFDQLLAVPVGASSSRGRRRRHSSEGDEDNGSDEHSSMPTALDEPIPFLARDAELDLLRHLWERACAGHRQLVLVSGPAGIGKTRLARELAFELAVDGARVMVGSSSEGPLVPYAPFAECLRGFLATAPAELRADALGTSSSELSLLLPELAGVGAPTGATAQGGSDPENERQRLFDAVVGVFHRLGRRSPVLLVIDDVQWADRASLLLLVELVRHRELPLLVMVSTRDGGDASEPMTTLLGLSRDSVTERGHPMGQLLALMADDGDSHRMPLGGVPPEAVATILEREGVARPGTALARAVWRATGGNPLIASHVARRCGGASAEDLQWLVRPNGRSAAPSHGASEVLAVVLDDLGDSVRRVLTAASAIGQHFEIGILAGLVRSSEATVAKALAEAGAAGLVEPVEAASTGDQDGGGGGMWRFTHDLVRQALHHQLGVARWVRLNRKLVDVLEAGGGDVPAARLAFHLAVSSPVGGSAKAAAAAARAGSDALEALAFEDAAEHFSRAIALLPRRSARQTDRADLLVALGDARRRAGDPGRARQAYFDSVEAATAAKDRDRVATAALSAAALRPVWGADDDLVAVLESALSVVGRDTPRGADLAARLAEARRALGSSEEPLLSDPPLKMARRSGEAGAMASMLRARHRALWRPEELRTRLQAADEMVELAEAIGDESLAVHARAWRAVDLLEMGRLAEADGDLAVHAARAAHLAQPVHQRDAAGLAAMRAVVAGRVRDARRLSTRLNVLGEETGDPEAPAVTTAVRLPLILDWGSEPQLRTLLDTCHDLAESVDGGSFRWSAALALVMARTGALEEAGECVAEMIGDVDRKVPEDATRAGALADWAEATALVGDARAAEILTALLVPYEGRMVVSEGGFVCKGSASRYLGLLAATTRQWKQANDHFEVALAVHERWGARPLVAHTYYDWGRTLVDHGRAGDHRAARHALTTAAELAQGLAMQRLANQARALLHSL